MKRYGNPHVVVMDKCPSYRAAVKVIGSEGRQETGRHLNNRLRIRSCRSEDERRRYLVSGACGVCKNSCQSIRQYTITSIIKGISRAGPDSNRYATLLFSNGGSVSSLKACSLAKKETGSNSSGSTLCWTLCYTVLSTLRRRSSFSPVLLVRPGWERISGPQDQSTRMYFPALRQVCPC